LIILRKHVAGLSETGLAKFVSRARRAIKLRGTVNVLVTSSRELRTLNRRFRDKDKPTDVLSFVSDPGFASRIAGDIAISADIAKQNAQRLGHAASQEIKILALHGLLHLAGYDHERDQGTMAVRELNLRKALRLPVGLIERNGELEPGGLPRPEGGTERSVRRGRPRPTQAELSELARIASSNAAQKFWSLPKRSQARPR